jgi:hypothetical protein
MMASSGGKAGKESGKQAVASAPWPMAPGRAGDTADVVYSFEFMRTYPAVRTFIFKKPFRKSMKESFMELFGGAKKRPAHGRHPRR